MVFENDSAITVKTNLSKDQFNKILCPNLRIGVRNGFLTPTSLGWITTQELRVFLQYIGVLKDSSIERVLVNGAAHASEEKPEYVNICQLAGTIFDHKSSSGILNTEGGFSEDRLTYLKTFCDDDGRLTINAASNALNDFHQWPDSEQSIRGTHTLSLEFSSLIETYGRESTEGKYLTRDDIDRIWGDSQFPTGWTPPRKATLGTKKTLALFVSMTIARFKNGWWGKSKTNIKTSSKGKCPFSKSNNSSI